jgi:hypothetical protein
MNIFWRPVKNRRKPGSGPGVGINQSNAFLGSLALYSSYATYI